MPAITIPGWVQTRVQFQTNQNTFGEIDLNWKTTGPAHVWTAAELSALNANLITNIIPTLRGLVPAAITIVRLISTDKGVVGGAQYETPHNGVGTATGDVENYNSTQVISERTGLTGRSHRGRLYMPPASEDSYQGGSAIPGYIAGLVSFATLLLNFTNTGGVAVDWAVASRKLLQLFTITSTIIDSLPDSQRRRLPGRGT